MLVGEQPGDVEDRKGHPFVGPAGRVLWQCVEDAGIPPGDLFVTNAVKHFKHEDRGKRRLHKKPNTSEIEACHPWLDAELRAVRPRVVVAMGATAARAVLGRDVAVGELRGRLLDEAGHTVVVTAHPSSILRVRDDDERHAALAALVADLKVAAAA